MPIEAYSIYLPMALWTSNTPSLRLCPILSFSFVGGVFYLGVLKWKKCETQPKEWPILLQMRSVSPIFVTADIRTVSVRKDSMLLIDCFYCFHLMMSLSLSLSPIYRWVCSSQVGPSWNFHWSCGAQFACGTFSLPHICFPLSNTRLLFGLILDWSEVSWRHLFASAFIFCRLGCYIDRSCYETEIMGAW